MTKTTFDICDIEVEEILDYKINPDSIDESRIKITSTHDRRVSVELRINGSEIIIYHKNTKIKHLDDKCFSINFQHEPLGMKARSKILRAKLELKNLDKKYFGDETNEETSP